MPGSSVSGSDVPAVVPGSLALARAESSFSHVAGINVRVPRNEAESAARRLLAEIGAVSVESKDASTNLRHVILRSSMGVSTLESVKGATSVKDADVLALARMGGEERIRAISTAEDALQQACGDSVGTTIVRLGALTDDAGGAPRVRHSRLVAEGVGQRERRASTRLKERRRALIG